MDLGLSPALIWFLVGLVLILSEIFLPGIIMVFVGAGAWIAALTTWWGWTDGLASQLTVFMIASVILLVTLRRAVRNRFFGHTTKTEDGSINLDDFTGQTVVVVSAVGPGRRDGIVEFKGAEWKAISDDAIDEGSTAEVVGTEGIMLRVRNIEKGELS